MNAIVVGAGVSGAVVSRHLAERGYKVTVWERRNHIAGNMYDYIDAYGIRVHKYGPHSFHTQRDDIYAYVHKFSSWEDFKLICMTEIDGKFIETPFNFATIDSLYPKNLSNELKNKLTTAFPNRSIVSPQELLESNDDLVRNYGQLLYEKDYKPYTEKQWALDIDSIDRSVINRVPIRLNYDTGYFNDKYQIMPKNGYTAFIKKILEHPNIQVVLNKNALNHISVNSERNIVLVDNKPSDSIIVYTGALDELFNNDIGTLPYRSLRFEWKYELVDSVQPAPVVAYPLAEEYTRITEYKKLPIQNVKGSSYAIEYPVKYNYKTEQEPYYPILMKSSSNLYKTYKNRAEKIKKFYFCGRLADFKYYNMDQAIDSALKLCKKIDAEI